MQLENIGVQSESTAKKPNAVQATTPASAEKAEEAKEGEIADKPGACHAGKQKGQTGERNSTMQVSLGLTK